MKYDTETAAVEFTVRVPVDQIRFTGEDWGSKPAEAIVPVAALMHLLEAHKDQVSIVQVIDLLKDHPDFEDALVSQGWYQEHDELGVFDKRLEALEALVPMASNLG